MLLAFVGLGPMEIVLIILGVVILFGGKKIPELMKGLGTGMKEFKKATTMEEEEPKKIDSTESSQKS